MKNKLKNLALILASTLALTGCDDDEVTLKEHDGKSIIFTLDGENYYADDLLADLADSSSAKSKVYTELSRKVFRLYAEQEGVLTEAERKSIMSDAESDVDDFKSNCESTASDEGTDYDTYLEDALEEEGVTTLKELTQKYYETKLKEEVIEDLVEDNYEFFLEKYLSCYTPFQVKHILVAANSADTNYTDGTMSTDNARKLLTIMKRFEAGDTFESIAEVTDDTSSAQNGGIMPFNEAQNYVSEFRFATYMQQIFNESTDAARLQTAKDLHIVDEDETEEEFKESNIYDIYSSGFQTIKYEDILKLDEEVKGDYAGAYNYYTNSTTVKDGATVPTVAEQTYEMNVSKYTDEGSINNKYYQEYEMKRNQIFNSVLNTHTLKFIEVPSTWEANKTTLGDKTVLADEYGNPVFFAIASTGIHFMSMVWNSYDPKSVKMTDEAKEGLLTLAGVTVDETNTLNDAWDAISDSELNKAYFTLFDSSSSTTSTGLTSVTDMDKFTYAYIGQNTNLSKSEITSNSSSLLSAIESYASNGEYYLFDALVYSDSEYKSLLKADVSVNVELKLYEDAERNTEAYDLIKEYVQDRFDSTDESFAESVVSAAETYGTKLAREKELKSSLANWEFQNATKQYEKN